MAVGTFRHNFGVLMNIVALLRRCWPTAPLLSCMSGSSRTVFAAHCYAVADSMRHFAQLRGADADLWEAVGLLHDMDYERHPNQEQSPTEGHPFVGVAALREQGWSEEVCGAIPT